MTLDSKKKKKKKAQNGGVLNLKGGPLFSLP